MSTASLPEVYEPLPWQARPLAHIRRAWARQRLPHALLLHGAEGLGKRRFARWLVRAVLCDTPQEPLAPCGECAGCLLNRAGSHPDLMFVEPLEDKQSISVEQIRDTSEQLAFTSFRGARKVAVVDPAQQMTVNAANSLLKTLEEPPAASLLVLVTSQPGRLPATIRSRCMMLGFPTPAAEDALVWLRERSGRDFDARALEFAGGAPFAALEAVEASFGELDAVMRETLAELAAGRTNVSIVAAEWTGKGKEKDLDMRLRWLEYWLTGQIRARIYGIDDQITQRSSVTHLPSGLTALNISDLYRTLDGVRELRLVLSRTALQRELAVESLLLRLIPATHPVERRRMDRQ